MEGNLSIFSFMQVSDAVLIVSIISSMTYDELPEADDQLL